MENMSGIFKKGLTNETEWDKMKKLSAMTTTRTLKIKQRKTKKEPVIPEVERLQITDRMTD